MDEIYRNCEGLAFRTAARANGKTSVRQVNSEVAAKVALGRGGGGGDAARVTVTVLGDVVRVEYR